MTETETEKTYRYTSALLPDGWHDNVEITVDHSGRISKIGTSTKHQGVLDTGLVALPGMANIHSHAFQRGLAGLSEFRTMEHDSFWTWRKLMYEFVETLTPEKVYQFALQLYREMRTAGYTWVGEFHYLHGSSGGSQPLEMAEAISRAADDTGIGLCLIPVLYQRGGFDNSPLAGGQKFFSLSEEKYVELVERCLSWERDHFQVGISLHSLRAVATGPGRQVLKHFASRENMPVHIHVAEQEREVEECLAVHARRPIEFLYEQFPVDENWCLIHATHLNHFEIRLIANSGAVVGLCPTTEANLGDGIFPAEKFLQAGGKIAIGSDSHCSIDWREELRLLEYGQRLSKRKRAVLGTENQSVGRRLYEATQRGGMQAMGLQSLGISAGERANFTLLNPYHPTLSGSVHDRLLDQIIFCNICNPVRDPFIVA